MNTIENIIAVLQNKGFEVLESREDQVFGTKIALATKKTDGGNIEIAWGDNGTARVQKPNGTTKWYYEKTIPQVARALDQCIEFNTYKSRWF